MSRSRDAFVLLEALAALLVIGIVFLALEGSLAIVVRSLASSRRQTIAVQVAESQRERAFAEPCAIGAGIDSSDGVRVSWSATTANGMIQIDQTSTYSRVGRNQTDTSSATGSCR